MAKNGWSRADLAREMGVSRSVVSDLLNGKYKHSPYVPDLHKVFGWSPPPPSLDAESEELMGIFGRLGPRDRGRLLERARDLLEASVDDERRPGDDHRPPAP